MVLTTSLAIYPPKYRFLIEKSDHIIPMSYLSMNVCTNVRLVLKLTYGTLMYMDNIYANIGRTREYEGVFGFYTIYIYIPHNNLLYTSKFALRSI